MGTRSRLFVLALLTSPLFAQKVGEVAPDILWTATHNFGDIPSKKLSELRGSVVLLEFISIRQVSSREEVIKLTAMHYDKADKGLVVISVTSENADDVAKYVKRLDIKRPVAVGFSRDFEVDGVPDGYLIDKDGKVLWHGHPNLIDKKMVDTALVGAKPAIVLPGLEEAASLRRSKDYGATWRKTKALLDAGGLSEKATEQAKDWMQTYEQFVTESLAAAEKALAAKDVFAQWCALQPVADWYQGIPGSDVGKAKFEVLMADPKNKKEIEAGKKYTVGKDKEAQYDYDGAYAIWKELAATFGATKQGKEAANLIKAYEKDGKLGYDNTCGYCKAGGVACPTHRKKKK